MTPCGDHTQLSSGLPGTFRYGLPPASICHSTREKFMRHDSPVGGRETGAREANAVQGKAISTVQPRSRSLASFKVPSIATAVRRPGISQLRSEEHTSELQSLR